MEFIKRKRRTPIVPIISLIDILAILLIFFILTTTFKEKKNVIAVDLPSVSNLETEADPERRFTLALKESGEFFFDGNPIILEDLQGRLESLTADQGKPKLELQADEAVPLGKVLDLWDQLKASGYEIREVPARVQVAN